MSWWWKVRRSSEPEILVLVVNGRIAASTQHLWMLSIGNRWDDARQAAERAEFVCVMEAS